MGQPNTWITLKEAITSGYGSDAELVGGGAIGATTPTEKLEGPNTLDLLLLSHEVVDTVVYTTLNSLVPGAPESQGTHSTSLIGCMVVPMGGARDAPVTVSLGKHQKSRKTGSSLD